MKPLLALVSLPFAFMALEPPALADDVAPAPAVQPPPASGDSTSPAEPKRQRSMDGQTIAALVGAGVAVVGFGIAAVYGVDAIAKRNDARAACPGSLTCATRDGVNKWNDASMASNVATVAFVVGCAGLVEAAVFWFIPTSRTDDSTKVGIGPTGIRLKGTF